MARVIPPVRCHVITIKYCFNKVYSNLQTAQELQQTVLSGRKPIINSSCPEDFACLMEECQDLDPRERGTFVDIVLKLEYMIQSHSNIRESELRRFPFSGPSNVSYLRTSKKKSDT